MNGKTNKKFQLSFKKLRKHTNGDGDETNKTITFWQK